MSSDFINPIGAKTPRLNQANQVAPQRAVQAPPQAETGNTTQAPVEGFAPSSEVRESLSEQKAGEAKASEILGAWGLPQANPTATAGQLVVSGASNTNVNQVHGVSNGVYHATNGPQPGFSDATVYSTRAPQG